MVDLEKLRIWDDPGETLCVDAAAEIERLLALTTRLRTAAESVCWFDWSNNDTDAVGAIAELRLALEHAPPS